jgi:hypothetical protein
MGKAGFSAERARNKASSRWKRQETCHMLIIRRGIGFSMLKVSPEQVNPPA